MKIAQFILGALLISNFSYTVAQSKKTTTIAQPITYDFDLQGHRGARGLAPENTIPAFKKALELGVNTLELDVVVSKDKLLVVSHEPWLNDQVTMDANTKKISKEEGLAYKIFEYTYQDLSLYDVGSLGNILFPQQVKEKVSKPLLSAVIAYAEAINPKIKYNIEIKSTPEEEKNGYQPNIEEFADLLVKELKATLPINRVIIQSFDPRVLQYLHKTYPEYTLAHLVFENDYKKNSADLGFIPQIYSPYYALLNPTEIATMHQNNMLVIPWTVNEPEDMKRLLAMGVDGIITDYPNLALPFRK
jgi:glycerophosphoryl diester phosphodiesterase